MTHRTRTIRTVAAGVLAVGLLAPATSTAATSSAARHPAQHQSRTSTENGRIAFSSGFILFDPDLGRRSQVFTVRPDGTHLRQLTHVPAGSQAGAPDISPDGRTIAYVSNVSGKFEVWTMNIDGSGQHALLGTPGFDYLQPRWSPDGSILVVSRCDMRFGFIAGCDLDLVQADGSGRQRLVGGHRNNSDPVFSPDGKWVAFDSDRAGYVSAVWVVAADGGRPMRLTPPHLEAFWPSWSPDGSHLIFSSNCCLPHSEVFVMRSDGSQIRQLTHLPADHGGAFFASYAPNGRRIVTSSDAFRPANSEVVDLVTMHTDGTHLTRIVTAPPNGITADWGPRP